METMMAAPKPSIRWMGTTNGGPPTVAKDQIVLHWAVGRMPLMDGMASAPNPRSSTPHFMVDGEHKRADGTPDRIHQYVDIRGNSSHTSGQNGHTVGIETAGGWEVTGQGLHQRYKPSSVTHEETAQLCAWIADQLGWGALVVGGNLVGHNFYSNTMCPGTLDLAWIANRVAVIRREGVKPVEDAVRREEAMYVVFVEQVGHLLIAPTFVRKIVDLPDASAKDTVKGFEKITKPVTVLPFGELYGIWSNVNAGTKDDSATGAEIRALAERLGVAR